METGAGSPDENSLRSLEVLGQISHFPRSEFFVDRAHGVGIIEEISLNQWAELVIARALHLFEIWAMGHAASGRNCDLGQYLFDYMV